MITGQEMWRLGEAAQLYSAVPKELEALSFPLLLEKKGYFTGYTQKGWAPNNFHQYGWDHNPFGFIYNLQELKAPTHGIVSNNYARNFRYFSIYVQKMSPSYSGLGARNHIDPLKPIRLAGWGWIFHA